MCITFELHFNFTFYKFTKFIYFFKEILKMSVNFDIESVINSFKDVSSLNIPKASSEYIKLEFLCDEAKVSKYLPCIQTFF